MTETLLPSSLHLTTPRAPDAPPPVYPPGVYRIVKPDALVEWPGWRLVTLFSRSVAVPLEHRVKRVQTGHSENCDCYNCRELRVNSVSASLGTEIVCLIVEPEDNVIERALADRDIARGQANRTEQEALAWRAKVDAVEAQHEALLAREKRVEKMRSDESIAHGETRKQLRNLEIELGKTRRAQKILTAYVGKKQADELLAADPDAAGGT